MEPFCNNFWNRFSLTNSQLYSHPLEDTHQTGLKKFLLLVKLKIELHGHMLLMISMVKKLLEHSVKKNYKRLIKKNLGIERVIKIKSDKLYVK